MEHTPKLIVSKDFTFEAAHRLPNYQGACKHLHGHSWKLTVAVRGPLDPATGLVIDFRALKDIVQEHIIRSLDHGYLGQGDIFNSARGERFSAVFTEDFYPTSENLVMWIVKVLSSPLVLPNAVELYEVTLHETESSACTWRRDG